MISILILTIFTGRTRELNKIKEVAKEKIASFIMDHMAEYFKFVRKRLEHEVSIVWLAKFVEVLTRVGCLHFLLLILLPVFNFSNSFLFDSFRRKSKITQC